ncbi:MAG: DNA-binding protein [Actinomycetota bacterium]
MAAKDSQAVTVRLSRDEYEALRTFAFVTDTSINEGARRALREFLVAQGRREEFDALLKKARTQYRVALDKLANL